MLGDSDCCGSPGDDPDLSCLRLHLRLLYCRALWLLFSMRLKLRQGLGRGDLQDVSSLVVINLHCLLSILTDGGVALCDVGMRDGQPELQVRACCACCAVMYIEFL